MKKSIFCLLAILIFIIPLGILCSQPKLPQGIKSAEIYITGDDMILSSDVNVVYTVGMKIIKVDYDNFNECMKTLTSIKGVSFIYDYVDVENVINSLDAKIIKCEKVDDILIYYAYSKKIDAQIQDKNFKYNIQIACKKHEVKVGIPMIYGSF